MDDERKEDRSANESDFGEVNRTVIVSRPVRPSGCTTPLQKVATRLVGRKNEIEDLVGGVDVSHHTNVELDTSAELTAPLSNLDTRYSVLEEFAQGGHATVSVARDNNLRRVVAIKSLKKNGGQKDEVVDSFVSEAKVTAQLDHPAIIPVYGLTGDGEKGVHLSMKLVNGRTLREYLRNIVLNYRIKGIKSFDEDAQLQERLEIFLRVCDAIAYAHHRRVMHRDLKPENIMLGKYMEVYVMDWGLAKVIPPEGEKPKPEDKVSGTPRYFSPEALRGDRCDARADIFSLGLILQEIVTLQFAVKGRSEKEQMDHIINGELAPVEHLFRHRIDRALRAIIRKATAYRVADRYQSVSDLAEDLRRYIGGSPVSAYPDTVFMKISRYFFRRRREFLAVVTALLLLSAGVTVYAVYRQFRTSQEINVRSGAMNYLNDRTATAATHLDLTALQIQEQLLALARISVYLLANNTASGEDVWRSAFRPALAEIGKTEKGMIYSPYYKRLTSMDYGIFTLAPGADRDKCFAFLKSVSPALRKMKNIVLGSQSGYNFDPRDYEKLKMAYLYNGFPVRSVFIGTEDGLKLLYPWRGNYPREIDPRKRVWYQAARKKRAPVWGKPYMDFDSISGLSIPCSVPIIDFDDKFRGVVGLDLSVNKLTERILQKGNVGGYVIEKAVVNRRGEVVFSSQSKFFNRKFDPEKFHGSAPFKATLFRTPGIRSRILEKGKEFETFIVVEGGKKVIYSFATLEVFDMIFVVVADYGKLVEHIEKIRKTEAPLPQQ